MRLLVCFSKRRMKQSTFAGKNVANMWEVFNVHEKINTFLMLNKVFLFKACSLFPLSLKQKVLQNERD